ncbi:hypothetical protein ACFL9T_13125 [Thermodesulfobacteriota bacterium]
MNKERFTRMRKTNGGIYLLIPFVILFLTSCSQTKSVYNSMSKSVSKSVSRTIRRSKSKLKKRVLVLPVLDQAGIGQERAEQLTSKLAQLLMEDEKLLVQTSSQPLPSIIKLRSPKFGIVIDPDLAKKAEEVGMNVLVTISLSPFEMKFKNKGIWPFKKVIREVEVSMVVNALDVINGTLYTTHLESRRVKMPEDDLLFEQDRKEMDMDMLDKQLIIILNDQADAIIESLRLQPWSGRVLSANKSAVMINAGRDVGVKEGSVFEVFGRGDAIDSASGRALYLLGPKVGEIKTAKVMETYSSADPLSGGNFKAGQVIKLRD